MTKNKIVQIGTIGTLGLGVLTIGIITQQTQIRQMLRSFASGSPFTTSIQSSSDDMGGSVSILLDKINSTAITSYTIKLRLSSDNKMSQVLGEKSPEIFSDNADKCFNQVQNGKWPNNCRGTANATGCDATPVALEKDEETAYQNWLSHGKPTLDACKGILQVLSENKPNAGVDSLVLLSSGGVTLRANHTDIVSYASPVIKYINDNSAEIDIKGTITSLKNAAGLATNNMELINIDYVKSPKLKDLKVEVLSIE